MEAYGDQYRNDCYSTSCFRGSSVQKFRLKTPKRTPNTPLLHFYQIEKCTPKPSNNIFLSLKKNFYKNRHALLSDPFRQMMDFGMKTKGIHPNRGFEFRRDTETQNGMSDSLWFIDLGTKPQIFICNMVFLTNTGTVWIQPHVSEVRLCKSSTWRIQT